MKLWRYPPLRESRNLREHKILAIHFTYYYIHLEFLVIYFILSTIFASISKFPRENVPLDLGRFMSLLGYLQLQKYIPWYFPRCLLALAQKWNMVVHFRTILQNVQTTIFVAKRTFFSHPVLARQPTFF